MSTLLFAVAASTGCKTPGGNNGPTIDSPPAAMPSGINVSAVLQSGGGWVNVGPNPNGMYEVLPGALPSGGMRFWFYAPWPGALKVTLDGTPLPKFEDVPQGQDPAATGYYRVINIGVNTSTPNWSVGIRPPNSKLGTTRYDVWVASVSLNPAYATGTPQHESAPLVVRLAPQKVYTVTVLKAGTGNGTVNSSPAGIQCGSSCSANFGPGAFTVQLQATPGGSSTFAGWSSSQPTCSGAGPCVLNSTGLAITATATFNSGTGTGPGAGCPGPSSMAGYTYAGVPGCATNDIAGHPSANLRCDAQGYFCCESVIGASAPRCGGGGQHEFVEDCMDYGPNAALLNHRGCYFKD